MGMTTTRIHQPVVLSYGLGVDSTAILLRWIHEPASRDFSRRRRRQAGQELRDLVERGNRRRMMS